MQWIAVESSLLSAIAHDGTTLHCRFNKGGEYSYANVNEALFDEMRTSLSIGKFFMQRIKGNPSYPATKIEHKPTDTAS